LSFARGGTGAGGFLRVDAVGGELFVRGHVGTFQLRRSMATSGRWDGVIGSALESANTGLKILELWERDGSVC
jgi:hypothetical protein